MTDRPDDLAEIEGTGARLAAWTIAAIGGEPASPEALSEARYDGLSEAQSDGLSEAERRQLQRVNDAVAALQAASRDRAERA